MAIEESENTLDEDMAETLKEIQGRKNEEESLEATPEGDDDSEIKAVAEETPAEEDHDDAKEAGETEQETEEEAAPAAMPETGDIDRSLANAPSSWRANAKAKWASLDPEIRGEIAKREHDMHQGVQKLKETADFGDRINKTLEPYAPLIRAENASPEQVVQNMLNSAYVLRQGSTYDKVNMIVNLAQQYGFFDQMKAAIANGRPPEQEQRQDLTEQDIDRRIEERLAKEQQTINQNVLQQEVEAFLAETNNQGELKHPYVSNVWQEMAALIEIADSRGKEMSFEEAYNNALGANSDTRPLIQGQQSQAGGTGKDHVAKALKANANNIAKKPSHDTSKPKPTGSVDDTLRDIMLSIKSRSA